MRSSTVSVVGSKNDDRILVLSNIFQETDDTPIVVVHRIKHARIDFHTTSLNRAFLITEALPGFYQRIRLGQFCALRDYAHLFS